MKTEISNPPISNFTHTPGPWAVGCAGVHGARTRVVRITGTGDLGNAVDDARLIAAAPDLLAALRNADAVIQQLGGGNDAFLGQPSQGGVNVTEQIRAALAKATAQP